MAESLISSLECHACSNGLIVFSADVETDRVLLECEESMSGRWEPDGKLHFLTTDMLTRPATYDEIRAMGWSLLIQAP